MIEFVYEKKAKRESSQIVTASDNRVSHKTLVLQTNRTRNFALWLHQIKTGDQTVVPFSWGIMATRRPVIKKHDEKRDIKEYSVLKVTNNCLLWFSHAVRKLCAIVEIVSCGRSSRWPRRTLSPMRSNCWYPAGDGARGSVPTIPQHLRLGQHVTR
jgi:hypothetical protein